MWTTYTNSLKSSWLEWRDACSTLVRLTRSKHTDLLCSVQALSSVRHDCRQRTENVDLTGEVNCEAEMMDARARFLVLLYYRVVIRISISSNSGGHDESCCKNEVKSVTEDKEKGVRRTGENKGIKFECYEHNCAKLSSICEASDERRGCERVKRWSLLMYAVQAAKLC